MKEKIVNINFKKIGLFIVLIIMCTLTWVWMLGGLSLPADLVKTDSMLEKWATPGILAFPATISIIMSIVALVLVVTGFTKKDDTPKNE